MWSIIHVLYLSYYKSPISLQHDVCLMISIAQDMIVEQPDSPRKWIAGYVDRDEDASVGKGAKTRRRSPPPASTKNRAAAAIDTTETSNQKKASPTVCIVFGGPP